MDIYYFNLIIELSKNIGTNKHAIKLVESKQPPYRPIYSLSLVNLKILKIYIKTHLNTGFIYLSKSPTGVSIFFHKKCNGNLYLYINY